MQEQVGVWFITEQTAFIPQDPGHGSMHLFLMHALLLAHSELITHSGLQFGGEPINVWRQEHDGIPLMFLHSAFCPHGDGWHGSLCGSSLGGITGGAVDIYFIYKLCKNIQSKQHLHSRCQTYGAEGNTLWMDHLYILVHKSKSDYDCSLGTLRIVHMCPGTDLYISD